MTPISGVVSLGRRRGDVARTSGPRLVAKFVDFHPAAWQPIMKISGRIWTNRAPLKDAQSFIKGKTIFFIDSQASSSLGQIMLNSRLSSLREDVANLW